MKRLCLVLCALLLGIQLSMSSMAAQTAYPESTEFGDNWTDSGELDTSALFGTYSILADTESFESVTGRAYWDPSGSRIVIVSMTLTSTDVAIRQGWEDAQMLQMYLSSILDPDFSLMTGSPAALEGCDEVERMGGKELGSTLPVGSTLCAPDSDTIILVTVAGTANDLTGVDASDVILQMLIQ